MVRGCERLHYTLETASDLADIQWQPISATLLATNSGVVEASVPADTPRRFFRLRK